jgi:hypothetical protein
MTATLARPWPSLLIAAALALGGCALTAPPRSADAPATDAAVAADPRAQIVFRFGDFNEERTAARVLVDGVDVGALGDFADRRTPLRLDAGTHRIRVTFFDRVLLDQSVNVANGERRALMVR